MITTLSLDVRKIQKDQYCQLWQGDLCSRAGSTTRDPQSSPVQPSQHFMKALEPSELLNRAPGKANWFTIYHCNSQPHPCRHGCCKNWKSGGQSWERPTASISSNQIFLEYTRFASSSRINSQIMGVLLFTHQAFKSTSFRESLSKPLGIQSWGRVQNDNLSVMDPPYGTGMACPTLTTITSMFHHSLHRGIPPLLHTPFGQKAHAVPVRPMFWDQSVQSHSRAGHR